MRIVNVALILGLAALPQRQPGDHSAARKKEAAVPGVRLEELTWTEAERHLGSDAVVVLPLGAAAKEHGPHLKLRNDLTLAEYLVRRVIAASPVVVAPPLTYHFYPAFIDYPGSTSLGMATARDMTADVIRSFARHGPRRFYVVNTGISTLRPLEATAQVLGAEGILLQFTDLQARIDGAARTLREQPGGTHADEIETSMMLYIDPAAVDMSKAVRDYMPAPPGPLRLTRKPNMGGTYSASGVWGDATLATREKGRVLVEALVTGILSDLENLRKATPPQASARAPVQPAPIASGRGRGAPSSPALADRCSAGDERTIRGIGPTFSLAWTTQDAQRIGDLWSVEGDIAHPDGSVERTSQVIRQNRAYLFNQAEYRASRHLLSIGNIRCLTPDIAVADGKWDLRDVVTAERRSVPPIEGLCTLVLKRAGERWAIEAYRYTITARPGVTPPTVLKRPGFIDR